VASIIRIFIAKYEVEFSKVFHNYFNKIVSLSLKHVNERPNFNRVNLANLDIEKFLDLRKTDLA